MPHEKQKPCKVVVKSPLQIFTWRIERANSSNTVVWNVRRARTEKLTQNVALLIFLLIFLRDFICIIVFCFIFKDSHTYCSEIKGEYPTYAIS